MATAAHDSIAQAVAARLALFDTVIATSGNDNLKGKSKLRAIHRVVGERFAYAGDSWADLPIWDASMGAVLVGVPDALADRVKRKTPVEIQFPRRTPSLSTWLRALRLHQWLKNLLLFVPLLTAFAVSIGAVANILQAFLAFSLVASATYLANDVGDLASDRRHPRKKTRGFASGEIRLSQGAIASAVCLFVGFAAALHLSFLFAGIVALYLVVTVTYSYLLKKYVFIDVLTLSFLYTLRVLAGAVAIEVSVSSWLLAFSLFVFLSLALVKRASELVSIRGEGKSSTHGRDYRIRDLEVLWPMGVGAALCAVVVFGLFIHSPETQSGYALPQLLWLAALLLIYWLGRLWIKTSRGEMHDDPLIYAVTNRGSLLTVLLIAVLVVASRLVSFGSNI